MLFSPLELSGGVSSVGSGLVSGCARSGVRVTDVLSMYCRESRAEKTKKRKTGRRAAKTAVTSTERVIDGPPPHSHSPATGRSAIRYSAGGSPPSRAECRDPADRSQRRPSSAARDTGAREGDGEGPAPP